MVDQAASQKTQSFSKKEAIKAAWEIVKKNLGFVIGVTLLMGVSSVINSILQKYFEGTKDPSLLMISTLLSLVFTVVNLVVTIGYMSIMIKLVDGKAVSVSDILVKDVKLIFKYFLGSLLYGLITLMGFLLLIIPGIIFSIKYQFFAYFIIDRGMGPMEAIKASGKVTQGHKMNLFLFDFLLMGVMVLGFLALGVGVLVAYPVVMIAMVYVYRKLAGDVPQEIKPAPAQAATPSSAEKPSDTK